MKNNIALLFLFLAFNTVKAQYNKEKISAILTGGSQKQWSVQGINTERPEKAITFKNDQSASIEKSGKEKDTEKWKVFSNDEIRWFLDLGASKYELIISYDKKGTQFIKLTNRETDKNASGYYEIKLTPLSQSK